MKKKAVHALVIAAVAGMPAVASAELTANAAATSDYVWRGMTQTAGGASVSGGIDYAADFGLYVGTWAANTSFGSYEHDLYAGFSKEFGPIGVDVGYVKYMYPQLDDDITTPLVDESDGDWGEAYLGLTWKMLSFKYSSSSDTWATGTDSTYIEVGADFEIAKDVTLSLHAGQYDFDKDDVFETSADPTATTFVNDDYTDFSVSLGYGDFTFAISSTNLPGDTEKEVAIDANAYDGDVDYYAADDNYKVYVTYSKEFTLLK